MIGRFLYAIALLAVSGGAIAAPSSPPPVAVMCAACQVAISVTNATARVQLPSAVASLNAVTFYNDGAVDVHFAIGDVTVVATTSSPIIAAGTSMTIYVAPGDYVAAITASSTSRLLVYQATGPIYFGSNNVVGGTIGSVTITAPLGSLAPSAGVGVTLDTTDAANLAVNDPCQSASVLKKSVAIAVSASATTTELVAASSGKKVYVCGFSMSLNGTTPSALFKTGTKVSTACDTSGANLSGAYLPTTGAYIRDGNGGPTLMVSITSGEICLVTAGTTPSAAGLMTYVQQ